MNFSWNSFLSASGVTPFLVTIGSSCSADAQLFASHAELSVTQGAWWKSALTLPSPQPLLTGHISRGQNANKAARSPLRTNSHPCFAMADPASAGGAGGSADPEVKATEGEGVDAEEDSYDAGTRRSLQRIPLLSVRAGPRDAAWRDRLKEEYKALIQYIKMNKENDNDWFVLAADDTGVRCVPLVLSFCGVWGCYPVVSVWSTH